MRRLYLLLAAAILLPLTSQAVTRVVPGDGPESIVTVSSDAAVTPTPQQQLTGGTIYLNHATADQQVTLLTAVAGSKICVHNLAGTGEKVLTPASGEKIINDGVDLTADISIVSLAGNIGQWVCVKAQAAGVWIVESNNGFAKWADPIGYDEYNTNTTLARSDCNGQRRILSTNTSGTTAFTLPDPVAGDICRFMKTGSGRMSIIPNASHYILGDAGGDAAPAQGNLIQSTGTMLGHTIVLEAISTTQWVPRSFNMYWINQ